MIIVKDVRNGRPALRGQQADSPLEDRPFSCLITGLMEGGEGGLSNCAYSPFRPIKLPALPVRKPFR